MLTDIDAYIDNDNTLKFVVALAPVTEEWWWYWGQTGAQVGELSDSEQRAWLPCRNTDQLTSSKASWTAM